MVLHLQDSLESSPTWCLHQRAAERGIMRCCRGAEELEFVLFTCDGVSITFGGLMLNACVLYDCTHLTEDSKSMNEA